jgi:hypothetical protein
MMAAIAAGWRATLTYPGKVSVADHPPSKYRITSAFIVPAKLIEEPPPTGYLRARPILRCSSAGKT